MGYLSNVVDALSGGGSSTEDSWTAKEEVEVLVVDDESHVAEMYRDWLSLDGYTVEVATGGTEALEAVSVDTDVVLLDRRMPGLSGDEVLAVLRSDDIEELQLARFEGRDPFHTVSEDDWDRDVPLDTVRKLDRDVVEKLQQEDVDPNVCMMTAVEPDFDIVDMDFDHYVTKSVDRDDLLDVVEGLASLEELDEAEQEYQSLYWKKTIIEGSRTKHEIQESEKFQELRHGISELEEEADDEVEKVKEMA